MFTSMDTRMGREDLATRNNDVRREMGMMLKGKEYWDNVFPGRDITIEMGDTVEVNDSFLSHFGEENFTGRTGEVVGIYSGYIVVEIDGDPILFTIEELDLVDEEGSTEENDEEETYSVGDKVKVVDAGAGMGHAEGCYAEIVENDPKSVFMKLLILKDDHIMRDASSPIDFEKASEEEFQNDYDSKCESVEHSGFVEGEIARVPDYYVEEKGSMFNEKYYTKVTGVNPDGSVDVSIQWTSFYPGTLKKVKDHEIGIPVPKNFDDVKIEWEFNNFLQKMFFDHGYEWKDVHWKGDRLLDTEDDYFGQETRTTNSHRNYYVINTETKKVTFSKYWDEQRLQTVDEIDYDKIKNALNGEMEKNKFVDHIVCVYTENTNQLLAYIDVGKELGYYPIVSKDDDLVENEDRRYVTFSPEGNMNVWDREPDYPEYADRPDYAGSNVEEFEEIGLSRLREILNKE